jgi:hypothetical protein
VAHELLAPDLDVVDAMKARQTIRWIICGSLAMICCSFIMAQSSGPTPLNSIVDAMERAQSRVRPQLAYRVVREYRLSGANRSGDSYVVAQVDVRSPSRREYKIQTSSGNNRGQQVVRRILDHEVEVNSGSQNAEVALDRANYDFSDMGEGILDGQDCYLLGLHPKRKDKGLIAGQAWVEKSSFVVRQIEGYLAKTPSWWLKTVHVKLTFADVQGTWLQTSMEAVADVRIAGPHTLTSRILDFRHAVEIALVETRILLPNSHKGRPGAK